MQEVRIVVGQRGWIHIGYYSKNGSTVILRSAQCVRRWGTTAGLGQLASDGPSSRTILDKVGTVEMHELAVVHSIICNGDKWASILGG